MSYIQLWCLDVDTYMSLTHITVNFTEKYKLKSAEQPALEEKVFLTINVVKCCLTTS